MRAGTPHDRAKERLSELMPGDAARELIVKLSKARVGNLEWYLEEKIVRTSDREELRITCGS